MNLVDKAIEVFSPQIAFKREVARTGISRLKQVNNSGYDEGGASLTKKSMKGFRGNSKSPQEDIDENLPILRKRSRSLVMNAPLATSAIKTNRTNVVGAGLKVKSKIDYQFLGLTQAQADQWEKNVEREFGFWASKKFCDAQRLNNFYELQQLALISYLMNGDGIGIIKRSAKELHMPYSLQIHLIEADRVSTPNIYSTGRVSFFSEKPNVYGKTKAGNDIWSGVEIDKNGAVVAYHISSSYPNYKNKRDKKEWVRIKAFGEKTGEPNILHLMESERCEQYRGVPYLAPVIESLKQITRYTEAELTAAVVTAFFTVFIKQNSGSSSDIPFTESIPNEDQIDKDDDYSYEMGAGTVNMLGPGEDAVMADPKRPASGFDPFVTSISKQIGAALEIPYELLNKSFMASYSASRAALLEAWKAFKMRRTWFANDFCQPIYELWLSEAVALGRIKAPNFFSDPAVKNAWCQAEWIGPSPGQIDPVKEVNASKLRVENGFSTRERETIELTGGDFDNNINQIKKENALLSEMQKEGGNENNG